MEGKNHWGGSRRKENESKRYNGKIAASKESCHLLSALHLSAAWEGNACREAYTVASVHVSISRMQEIKTFRKTNDGNKSIE